MTGSININVGVSSRKSSFNSDRKMHVVHDFKGRKNGKPLSIYVLFSYIREVYRKLCHWSKNRGWIFSPDISVLRSPVSKKLLLDSISLSRFYIYLCPMCSPQIWYGGHISESFLNSFANSKLGCICHEKLK